MDLPKLPKLLDVRGLDQAQKDLSDRVWEWVNSAQDLLSALRSVVPGMQDTLTSGVVPPTRQVIAGTGLTGGGPLSSDVTLSANFGTTAGTIAQGNDARLSDSRTPNGSAGGDLAGTYPNPTVAAVHETSGPTKLDIGAVADGQLLVRSGSTLIGSGSAGGAIGWCPDAANPTPHADDQEFNGGSIPAGWSKFDQNSVLTDTYADGFAQFANATHVGNDLRGIHRACPSEAEWRIWTRVQHSSQGNTNNQIGIFVAEDLIGSPTTAKWAIVWFAWINSTDVVATMQTWASYTSFTGTQGSNVAVPAGQSGYLGFGYDGTNTTGWFSLDGVTWYRLATAAKSFTPVRAGIAVLNTTGVTVYNMADFYRVQAAAGASGYGAGLFRGART